MLHIAWAATGRTGDSTTVASRTGTSSASVPPNMDWDRLLGRILPYSIRPGDGGAASSGLMRVRSRLLMGRRSEPAAIATSAAAP